jgi:hypothetical protein
MPSALRIVLASLVLVASLAAAVWLYAGYDGKTADPADPAAGTGLRFGATQNGKADWQDPLALVLIVVGVGASAALFVPWRRRKD